MKMTYSKKQKICAFCKYWYDVANAEIEPVRGMDVWVVKNIRAERLCMAITPHHNRPANYRACKHFESKVDY